MQPSSAIKWGLKAVGGLLANLALLTVWVDGFGIWPELAIGINWLLLSVVGYVLADRWIWPASESPVGVVAKVKRWASMQGVMASGKVLNYLVYVVLLRYIDYRLAWVVGAVATFAITFGGNDYLWSPSET